MQTTINGDTVTVKNPDGVILEAEFKMDRAYFAHILQEVSQPGSGYPAGLTVEKLYEGLAAQIMEGAYYAFQDHLEGLSGG